MTSLKLDDLNPAQRAAVLAPDGPALILAGAGSGKTRVLTYRIAHLLVDRKVAPGRILAVTFTNKAANEMRERVATLVGARSRWPWVSTFHAACAGILRQEAGALGYDRNFTILDEGDTLTVIRRVIEEAALPDSPPPEVVRARIDQAKNEAIFAEQFANGAASRLETAIAQVYLLYQERLGAMNALDFGDLLLMTHRLFERDPRALQRWRLCAEHLLVDEYQDTNRVQYMLVHALSAGTGNLFVVGDEDQSIYRWRGADIRNILDFERDFPQARIFKLEQNYRSTKTILAAADAVIRNNRERKVKHLWTENPDGELVTCYTGSTEREEADFIAREIARLAAGTEFCPADIVVFYRVNAQSRAIEEALVRRRIPYCVVGGVRFYEQRDVKDLFAYLRVIANPADSLSLQRLVAVPPRGIGLRTVQAMAELAGRRGISLFEAMGRLESESKVALRIAKQASALFSWMRDLMARAGSMTVRTVLDEIVLRTGFVGYLEGLADGAARRQNLAETLSAADSFDAEHGPGGLGEFLERVALVSDSDQITGQGGKVALMTLHTSKGLEYPVVFIAGMEEGIFPHVRSQDSPAEIEEERRLCYVGMTRARRLLYLTNTYSRELYGVRQESRASRFLAEVASGVLRQLGGRADSTPLKPSSREPYVDYSDSQVASDNDFAKGLAVGTRVIHQTFGIGVVRRREGRGDAAKAWVNFEHAGLKLLVLKFANLRPVAD